MATHKSMDLEQPPPKLVHPVHFLQLIRSQPHWVRANTDLVRARVKGPGPTICSPEVAAMP